MEKKEAGFSTRAVHAGEDHQKPENAITTPIYQTSTFVFRDSDEVRAYQEHRIQRYEYGRYGNPTQRAAEEKLAALEGAEDSLLCASGMSAITSTLIAMLRSGGHLIITNDSYRRTRQFCLTILQKFGIETTVVPAGDYEAMEKARRENTRLFLSESPTNPYLYVLDLERVAAWARAHRIRTIIDSTLATPYNLRPLSCGIDLVIHSGTKYLGGHNDLMAGAVVGGGDMVGAIRDAHGILGGVIDPHSAYLLIRGLKTLSLRVERQNATALGLAQFLEGRPKVKRVFYPGLASHLHHAIAARQMKGFGGVVSFELDCDLEATSAFVDRLKIPQIGPSLGGAESLIEQPALMSYWELSREERYAQGIRDGLVRYSVGLEDLEDLIEDLRQSLEKI